MDVPTGDEIRAWLATEHRCDVSKALGWSQTLTGLPWRYIRPVVQIAVNSRTHPAVALAMAAGASKDREFVTVATRHLKAAGSALPDQ